MLSTCAFSAINSNTACIESVEAEIRQSMANLAANLSHLNATSSGTVISVNQLEMEAGALVSELCSVRFAFKSIGLTLNEFVALKVIAMTSIMANGTAAAGGQPAQPPLDMADRAAVLMIRDRYLRALVSHLSHKKPPLGSGSCSTTALGNNANGLNGGSQLGPNTAHVLLRMNSLLQCLARVTSAANLLLASKMFYVPFLMNSSSVTQAAAAATAAAAAVAVNGNHYHLSHLQHLNQLHHYTNGSIVVNGNGAGPGVVVTNGNGAGSTGSSANSPLSSSSNSSVASTLSSRSPSTSPPSSVAISGSGVSSVVVVATSGAGVVVAGGGAQPQAILAGGTGSNCS